MPVGRPKKSDLQEATNQVIQETEKTLEKEPEREGDLTRVISTGSTLLDLSISGVVLPEGGIPGGIMVEIFGGESTGKTALLCEICASAQSKGGRGLFLDPEGRINEIYSQIYGIDFYSAGWDIRGPEEVGSVEDFFSQIRKWEPGSSRDFLDVVVVDSLAALASEEELKAALSDEEKGMAAARRAGKFSEGLRTTKASLSKKSRLLVCSNQVRDDLNKRSFGPKDKATGGRAIAFWASLRIRVTPSYPKSKISVSRTINGTKVERVVGILSDCEVVKSSIDVPYRECQVPIIFNYGIDDVRGCLSYLKEIRGTNGYELNGRHLGGTIETAIRSVEENQLMKNLRQETINVWGFVEAEFKISRKPKER